MENEKKEQRVMNSSVRFQFDWFLWQLISACREAVETLDNERLPVLTTSLVTACKAYHEYEAAYYVGW